MRAIGVGLLLVLAAAGCAPKQAANTPNAFSASSGQATIATAATHSWRYRQGQDYAYQAQLSDDQQRAGQTVPTTQIYRYLGQRGGVFVLQVDSETATCANPCQVITLHTGVFHVERVAFDPDSLIGAAFTDAFNGQLAAYDPARASPAKGVGGSR
jgi:hypothetical protein